MNQHGIEPLLTEEQIRHRVGELAAEISEKYKDVDEVLLVGVYVEPSFFSPICHVN